MATAKTSKRTQWIVFATVGVLSLLADVISKIWARSSLPTVGHGTGPHGACIIPDDWIAHAPAKFAACTGADVPVIAGFWKWRLSMNPGSAFGLFAGLAVGRILLSLVGIGAVVWIIVTLHKARPYQKILHWALALIASGAICNLIDRVYSSVVTDFISWDLHFMVWPTFNVADIVLVVGVGLMFIDIQKETKREKALKAARQEKARDQGLVKDLQE